MPFSLEPDDGMGTVLPRPSGTCSGRFGLRPLHASGRFGVSPAPSGGRSGRFGVLAHASGRFGVTAPSLIPPTNKSGRFGLTGPHASGRFGIRPAPHSGRFGLRLARSGRFGVRANQSGRFGIRPAPHSGRFGLKTGQSGRFGLFRANASGRFGVRWPCRSGRFGLTTDIGTALGSGGIPPASPPAGATYPPLPGGVYQGPKIWYRLGNRRTCTISGSWGGSNNITDVDPSGDDNIHKQVNTYAEATFGPLSAAVNGAGLRITLQIPKDRRGNTYSLYMPLPGYDAYGRIITESPSNDGGGGFSFEYQTELWACASPYGAASALEIREFFAPGSHLRAEATWNGTTAILDVDILPTQGTPFYNAYGVVSQYTYAPQSGALSLIVGLSAFTGHFPDTYNQYAGPGGGDSMAGTASGYIRVEQAPCNWIPQSHGGALSGSTGANINPDGSVGAPVQNLTGNYSITDAAITGSVTYTSPPTGVQAYNTGAAFVGNVTMSPLWEYNVTALTRTMSGAYPDNWKCRVRTNFLDATVGDLFDVNGGSGKHSFTMHDSYGWNASVGGYLPDGAHPSDSGYMGSTLNPFFLQLQQPDSNAVHDEDTGSGTGIYLHGWQWDALAIGQADHAWVDKAPVRANWTAPSTIVLTDTSGGLKAVGSGVMYSPCSVPAPNPDGDVYAGRDWTGFRYLRLWLNTNDGSQKRAAVQAKVLLDTYARYYAAYGGPGGLPATNADGSPVTPPYFTKRWEVQVGGSGYAGYVDIDLMVPANNTASEDDLEIIRIDSDPPALFEAHKTDMLMGMSRAIDYNVSAGFLGVQLELTDSATYILKQIELLRDAGEKIHTNHEGHATADFNSSCMQDPGGGPAVRIDNDGVLTRYVAYTVEPREIEIADFFAAPDQPIPAQMRTRGLTYTSLHPYLGTFDINGNQVQTSLRDGLLHNSRDIACLGGLDFLFDVAGTGTGTPAFDWNIAQGLHGEQVTIPGQFVYSGVTYMPPGVGNVWNESYSGTAVPILACRTFRTDNRGYVFDQARQPIAGKPVTAARASDSSSLGSGVTDFRGAYQINSSLFPSGAVSASDTLGNSLKDVVSAGGVRSLALRRYPLWRRTTHFAVPHGYTNPSNWEDDWGRLHRVAIGAGNVTYWRSEAAGPGASGSMAWECNEVAVTSGGTDAFPRVVTDGRGNTICVFGRDGSTTSTPAWDAFRAVSWDDGQTWNEAEMAIAGGHYPINAVGRDGLYLEAAVVNATGGSGARTLQARCQGTGDAAMSDVYTLVSDAFISGAAVPLAPADDTFSIQQGRSLDARWLLSMRVEGETSISEWVSSDVNAKSWTRVLEGS